MKPLLMSVPSAKQSLQKLTLMKRRWLVTISLLKSLHHLGYPPQQKLARRLVKKLSRSLKRMPSSKHCLIQTTKTYRLFVKRGLKLSRHLKERERKGSWIYQNEVRYLSRSIITAPTPVVGQRAKVRGLICRTLNGGLFYAKVFKRRKATLSLFATSRRLNRAYLPTLPTIKLFLKSLRQGKTHMRRSERRCLVLPVSIRKTMRISGSRRSQLS